MVAVDEMFDEIADSDEMSIAEEFAGGAQESEEEIEQEEVASFREQALGTANKFKDWVLNGLKGLTVEKVVLIGTGVLLIYQIIEKHAQVASDGGKKVKLSSAIDGTRKTLVDKYDETIHSVAVKTKENTDLWDKLPPDAQKTIEAEIAETGDVYWLLIGEEIMQKLAEMPIYDPTA